MTPAQAATIIGCTPAHVRLLIRRGAIRSRKRVARSPRGFPTHSYSVSQREAERIRKQRDSYTGAGRPRNSQSNPSN